MRKHRIAALALAGASILTAAGTQAAGATVHAPSGVYACHLVKAVHGVPVYRRTRNGDVWDLGPADIVPPFVLSNGKLMRGQNWNGATAAFWSHGCQ